MTHPNDLASTLTKHEYFTILIFQGLEASNFASEHQRIEDPQALVELAVARADMLINELNKTGEE